jgi:2',3'-cyclic-nucleotide 2'-phosphodiesterase
VNILLIGDVFGKPGRRAVRELLPGLRGEHALDFVIANGENAAGGKGMTEGTCRELFDAGVDVITSGNHVRSKSEIDDYLRVEERVVRPLNWPEPIPGKGFVVRPSRVGVPVAVVNSMGRVHINMGDSPFEITKRTVEEMKGRTPVVVVDFHAEATSEARMMGWYLDGLATAVLGTHTHVQTADEEVLPQGTAYITDVGMTGPHHSVIGLSIELAERRFFHGDRNGFEVAKKDVRLCGAIVDADEASGRARSIRRIQIKLAGG